MNTIKLLFLSDLHLALETPRSRLDDYFETGFNKLDYILSYAKKHSITEIIQAGDFVDGPRGYQILSKIMSKLDEYSVTIKLVVGSHDRYLGSENLDFTNIGILAKAKYVEILNEKPTKLNNKKVSLYGCSYGHKIPRVTTLNSINILIIHSSISNLPLPYDYIPANKFLEDNNNFSIILCGHIHQKFIISNNDRIICNTGPVLRSDASKEMLVHKPSFLVYDTENNDLEEIEIPSEPAEKVLTRIIIEKANHNKKLLTDFITTIKNNQSNNIIKFDVKDMIQQYCKENNIDPEIVKIIEQEMVGE